MPRRTRLPSLTGLRVFAAVFVIFDHSASTFTHRAVTLDASAYGFLGVQFFFVLSGFVLAWSRRSTSSVRNFYRSRFARYWPLHLVTLFFAATAVQARLTYRPHDLGLVSNLLLLQAWSPHAFDYYAYNGVAWSLSCEVFFYLVFPFLDRWIDRLSARGLRRLAVGTVGWMVLPVILSHAMTHTIAFPGQGSVWFWLTYVCPAYQLGLFVTGLLLVRIVDVAAVPRVSWIGVASLAVTAAAVLAVCFGRGRTTPAPDLAMLVALPFVCALIVAAASSDIRRAGWSILRTRPLTIAGECSFALYLVHQLILKRVQGAGGHIAGLHATDAETWGLYIVVVAAAAAAMHFLVERPVERFLTAPRPTGRAAAPPVVAVAPAVAVGAKSP